MLINLYKIIYTVVILPAILILSLFSKKLRAGTKQKLGGYKFKNENKNLWIHAVSVGEVMLASTLVHKIPENIEITVTVSTPQGFELARNKLSNRCKVAYFPYDTCCALKKAIEAINPFAAIIVETEIWPNFAQCLKKREIPLYIVNGRISERTFKTYKKLKFFFSKVFENYTAILAQSGADAERFRKIGAADEIVTVSGNIKFDIAKPDENIKNEYLKSFKPEGFKVLTFASTHGDENEKLIKVYRSLSAKIPDLKLIIAPRHLEKVSQIEGLLADKKYGKRSLNADFCQNDVIILDTTGELSKIYSISDIAVIAGSFNNTGGHNPLEATVWGKPTITGPNIKNFKYIYNTLIDTDCAIMVKTTDELEKSILELLNGSDKLKNIEKNCTDTIAKNSGATDFTVNYIFKREQQQ